MLFALPGVQFPYTVMNRYQAPQEKQPTPNRKAETLYCNSHYTLLGSEFVLWA
jgi:hypothetical protein